MSFVYELTDKEGIFIHRKTGFLLKERNGIFYLFANRSNGNIIPLKRNDIITAQILGIPIDSEAFINTGPHKG